ncbi:MAG: nuclear transport factor 2 family protein [Ferruginibacter sp.]
MKILMTMLLGLACFNSLAQDSLHDALKESVLSLSTAMKNADTGFINKLFTRDALISSVNKSRGEVSVTHETIPEFSKAIIESPKGSLDERIMIGQILIDGDLAVVWATYKFYFNNIYSHCGVDVIHLVRLAGTWKIISVTDTRRVKNCPM